MLRSRPDDRQRRWAERVRRAQRSGANSGRIAAQIRPLPLGHRGQSGQSSIAVMETIFPVASDALKEMKIVPGYARFQRACVRSEYTAMKVVARQAGTLEACVPRHCLRR